MAVSIGLNARIYYTDGTPDDPLTSGSTMTELSNVTDVTVNLSRAEADITTRGAGGYRAKIGTLKEGSIEFEMLWDTEDAAFQDIFDAWNNGTVLYVAALDRALAVGAQGLYAPMSVLSFEKQEPLEDAQRVSVTLSVTVDTALEADFITVAT